MLKNLFQLLMRKDNFGFSNRNPLFLFILHNNQIFVFYEKDFSSGSYGFWLDLLFVFDILIFFERRKIWDFEIYEMSGCQRYIFLQIAQQNELFFTKSLMFIFTDRIHRSSIFIREMFLKEINPFLKT